MKINRSPSVSWLTQLLSTCRFESTLLAVFAFVSVVPSAHAHLMLAQHGTLNFVGNGGFIVLSVAASAFAGADTDGDNHLSTAEFRRGLTDINASIKKHIRLIDPNGSRPIEGLMVSPARPHGSPDSSSDQIVVMGRFVLKDPGQPLRLALGLFGKLASEQKFQVRVSRNNKTERELLSFTPENHSHQLFAKSG